MAELPKSLFLSFHHDEDITVFLNGRQILHRTGYSTYYQTEDVTKSAISALQTGQNVLAVHVKQTIGGQFFDLSLRGFAKPVNLTISSTNMVKRYCPLAVLICTIKTKPSLLRI